MKTTTIRMLSKSLTALCFVLLSFAGYSQTAGTAVLMELKNVTQPTASTLEYEVWVTNSGTTSLALRGYSCGVNAINLPAGVLGTLSMTYLGRDASLSTLPNPTVATPAQIAATPGHLRLTTVTAVAGNEVVLASLVPVRVATVRVTTALPGGFASLGTNFNWLSTTNPLQVTTQAGRTQCIATCFVGALGTNYSCFGTANPPTATSINVLTGSVVAPAASLNPLNCLPTAGASSETACDTYTWAGGTHTSSGTYVHTFVNGNSCGADSVHTLTLTINNSTTSTESATACDSYVWACNGLTYNASGSYTCTSLNTAGCVNTATLNLTINASTTSTETASSCTGSYVWACDGLTYNASGTYTCTSLNTAGCVNTATLNLTIGNATTSTETATACDSYVWACNGQTYNASGMYTCTSLNAAGCVNTATLDLTINASTTSTETATACDSYVWACNGQTYNASGMYTCTSTNAAGCVNTATLDLTINASTTSTETATACDSYVWACNGQTYNASGAYTCTSVNAAGCVNTATLNLTINASSTSTETVTACDSYVWACNGQTYNASGMYTCTSTNAAGCVNTATLDLTINASSTSTETATACDSYVWACNGQTYNASGMYTCTSTNAAGCVNTATLDLTINASSTSTETASACDTYTWTCNGATYTTSGMYTCTSINAAGCVNTATLDLTINASVNTTQTVSACDSYTWSVNSTTYTASGLYTVNTGCATATLDLTITPSTSNSTSATACDSYTWSVNNVTYTASGTWSVTTGCNTETLVLTVNNSSTSTETATACDSYVWACNGQTYNASGMYTCTSLNAAGCVNTATLDLTINTATTSTETATACDSYVWACNGQTYNASGMYTCTSLNAAGCVNTATLDLTINASSTSTETATACDSYVWACNGQTYNASGMYTCTSLNAAGCVNTATLDLTINASSTSTETATACDSYVWACNGQTYNASGMYTCTSLNAAGCVNTATLDLTINTATTSATSATATGSYVWACDGATYTASGVYTCTSLNANGCVNTETLTLTINPIVVTCGTCAGFTLSVIEDQPISCNGNLDASLQATASPAGTYTYSIVSPSGSSPNNTSGYFDMLVPGTHTVYATDGTCTTCQTIFFLNPDPLDITFVSDSMVSCNGNDGQLSVVISGGTNVLQGYLTWWTNAAGDTLNDVLLDNFATTMPNPNSPLSTPLSAGNYNVAIEDDRGCFYNETGAIDVAPAIVVTAPYTPITCAGGTTVISPSGTGGVSYPAAYASTLVYTINGAPVAASYPAGTYTVTATDYKNCSNSIVVTIANPSPITGTSSETACDMFMWNGTTYTMSGAYVGTFAAANGCDSVHTLNLTINYSTTDTLNATACDTYTWATNNTAYTTSGQYTAVGTNTSGCPLTHVLNLTINNSTTSSETATSCDSYTWACNGETYTVGGSYTCTSLNSVGCVNTATLTLTIGGTTSSTDNITACDSYTWAANGVTYTASGSWTVTSLNASGCTHTSTLNLTVNYSTSSTTSYYWCDMYTWPVSGMTYTASGTYAHTTLNAAGCTNTQYLNLTLGATTVSITCCVEACGSYTWAQNGITYTASGSYYWIGQNASGCPDVHTLCLTINQPTASTETATACNTYTWAANGMTYTASGMYTVTSLNAAGCVHTTTLDLTITTGVTTTTPATACDSYTWTVNGMTYTTSGMYTSTMIGTNGCVNTEILDLTVNYSTANTTSATACDTYSWTVNNMTYTMGGTYVATSLNAAGCTHTETLVLTINASTSNTSSATACDTYTWTVNGATYTMGGTYTSTSLNAAGCTHTETLVLTINASTANTTTETACDTYTWTVNNMTYTMGGTYTSTSLNAAGCTHTETLVLTINASTSNSTTATACDTYTWTVNGATYTMGGTYTSTSLNAAGCTHTETLVLTVNYSSASTETAFACDSYAWTANGMTYTTSGMYTSTSLNASGCVHTTTLDLTVHYNSTTSETATACDTYTWNGNTYTVSGVYTFTSINGAGTPPTYCAAGANITCANGDEFIGNVTVGSINNTTVCGTTYNDYTSLSTSVTPGSSYAISVTNPNTFSGDQVTVWADWNQNGLFTDAGEETTLVYATGVATGSIAVPMGASVGATRMRVRLNYTGAMLSCGNTQYGEVEDYTLTVDGPSTTGCVNTATLNLTINNSTTSTETMTACDSYTWPCNNATYTASGVYTCTSLNAAGCVNTATLTLTINASTSSSMSANACDSYTWAENSATYTVGGTYVHTSLNAAGCTHTATLTLVVNYSSTNGNETTTACDSYTWNGTTYTATGVYTYTTFNAPTALAYCAAGTTNQGCISGDEFIENVTLGTINNTSTCGAGGYEDYSAQSTAATAGSSLAITVTNGNDFSGDQIKVWADWNQNGTFEATETTTLAYVYGGTTGASNVTSGSIAVPAGAVDGATRVRVRLSYTGTNAACGSVTFGEVEDYTVVVSGGVSAPTPCVNTATLTLTINNSTTTSTTTTQCDAYTWNGTTYTTAGTYTYTSLNAAGCLNTDTLNLTINYGSSDTVDVTACNSYTWTNGVTYTMAGQYSYTYNNSFGCASMHTLNLTMNNGVVVAANAMLRGAYDASTGLMKDSLRQVTHYQNPAFGPADGQFLVGAPVNVIVATRLPFALELPCAGDNDATMGGGNAATIAAMMAVSGPNAIVDWVLIEVRDGSNYNTVVSTKNALIQRDGDVVSSQDGVSPLTFSCVCPGNYYVSIKHRNHLGVMTANTVTLTAASTFVPFSDATTPVWVNGSITNTPRSAAIGSVATLWGGDANTNKNAKYNGLSNDKEVILTDIGGPGNSNVILYQTYKKSDLNMDGKVRYNNFDNDKNWLLQLITSSTVGATPNDIISQHTPN